MSMHMGGLNKYQIRQLELADHIERLPRDQFDMRSWLDRYNCPSCIAAWAVWDSHYPGIDPRHVRLDLFAMNIREAARAYLGLSNEQATILFSPHWQHVSDRAAPLYGEGNASDYARQIITPKWAAAALRYLAFTGKVDWIAARSTEKREQRTLVAA